MYWKHVKLTLLFAAGVLAPAPLSAVRAEEGKRAEKQQGLCAVAEQAMQGASRVRGLKSKGPVPCVVSSRAEIEQFLRTTIKDKFPPHKLQAEQLVYRAVGLIPDDYNYTEGLIELYLSQIGGYYDPEKKHFVMADWMPSELQEVVAVHELTHALQDQYINLEQLLDPKNDNGDELLAYSALVEGDATLTILDSQHRRTAQPSSEASQDLPQVPTALKAILFFPYTYGLKFARELLEHGGYKRINQALRDPPQSSREILHPAEYLSNTQVRQIPRLEELDGVSDGYSPEYSDTLGEFSIKALLDTDASGSITSAQGAAGWVGDRIGVFPVQNKERLISWLTRWESAADAQEFFKAYKKLLEARYGKKISAARIQLTPIKALELSIKGSSVSIRFYITQ